MPTPIAPCNPALGRQVGTGMGPMAPPDWAWRQAGHLASRRSNQKTSRDTLEASRELEGLEANCVKTIGKVSPSPQTHRNEQT